MNPEEVRSIIENAIDGKFMSLWIYMLLSSIFGFVSAFLLEYLKTKGKNLATKSDIEALTKKVEEIKFEYFRKAETLRSVQDISNPKRKELYKRVEELRWFLFEMINDSHFNDLTSIYSKTKDLLLYLASNETFRDMKTEMSIIESDYNNWVGIANSSKTGFGNINTSKTVSALESIQKKILE
jgi:hypothetical protein